VPATAAPDLRIGAAREAAEHRPRVTSRPNLTDRDRIFDRPGEIGDFIFDAAVAQVFPDMITRSVPGYAAIINMIELLTGMYAQPGSRLYDLGCSLGAASLAMARGLRTVDCRITAVDNAPAMLEKAAEYCGKARAGTIEFRLADVRDLGIDDASVVVLNFTLQFLPLEERDALLGRILAGLRPGGILILSEKIAGDSPQEDAALVEMHHAFKRQQGYSDLEISQKRSALERVLLPETLGAHLQRLQEAGFREAYPWFQCFNFVSILARA
jgi:tRNA (cmo5U34)-methyltransferase